MSWIYFLKHKSEVFKVFIDFDNMICTQLKAQPRIFRTNNGREYVNSDMHQFLTTKGIIHQTSCPNTPQQNGVAEGKNRTLLEMTRAIMLESRVPTYLWPEAVATTNYLTNHLPTKSLNYCTPLDTLKNHNLLPFVHSLSPKIFGCIVFVHYPKRMQNKLEPRAVKCVFVGYGRNQTGYRCYDTQARRVYTTMDCEFIENDFYYHHPRCQGEKKDDDLRWLNNLVLSNLDQKEQVGNAAEPPHLAVQFPSLPILSDH